MQQELTLIYWCG